jgi:Protein of unknown function (DUF551)
VEILDEEKVSWIWNNHMKNDKSNGMHVMTIKAGKIPKSADSERKWISIEDRLPPQNVYVIVAKFDPRPKVEMHFILTAERMGDDWYDGKDGQKITGKGKYGRVTHWMPLPDKPEHSC